MHCFKSLPTVLALLVVLLLCRYSTLTVSHHGCSPPPPSAITVPNVESGVYNKWRPSNILRPQIGRRGTDSWAMFSVSQVEANGLWCQVRNNHTAGMGSNIGDWYYPTPLNGTTLVPTSPNSTAPYLSLKCANQTGLIIVGNVTDYQGIVRCVTTVPNLSRQTNYFGVYSDEVYNSYTGPNVDSNMTMKLLSSRVANTFKFNLIFNVSNGPPSKISCLNGTQLVDSSDIVREVIRSHYVSSSQPDITRVTLTQTLTTPRPYTCTVTVEGRVNIITGKYDFVTKGIGVSTAQFTVTGIPTAVNAIRTSFNLVRVSWNPPLSTPQPAGYEVFYQTASDVGVEISASNQHNITLYLTARESYTIFVVSYGEDGETVLPSAHSNKVIVPAIPTITNLSSNTSTIMVSWEIPQLHPQYYNVTYLCHLLCNSHQIISKIHSTIVDGLASNYTTTCLKAGTGCTINVTAVFNDGNSNTVTASTNTTSAAPAGAPVGLTKTTVNNTSITVVWDTVPCSHQNGPITGYKLFYMYNDTNGNTVSVNISGNNHRLYDIQGLTPSTRYTISVAAVNDGGTGPYSDPPCTVWTLNFSKFQLVIRDPIISSNNFSIVVSWTPPLLIPSYYNITYLCSLLCDSQQISENSSIVAGEAVTHTIYPLNAHSQCNVSVTAVFDSIGSNRITFLTNTTSAVPKSAPPGLTNVSVSSHSVHIMWNSVSCLDQRGFITSYKLHYSNSNTIVDISGQDSRMYNITGLTPSTRYTIAVAAVNDGGTGPYSDPPLTVWTLSDTGTDITGHIGTDVGPVTTIMLFIIFIVTVTIIAVVVALIKRHRKTNKADVLHMGENPSYSITTFSKKADSQHYKASNEAVTDVPHMDENPSYCATTSNKTPDDCGTNMCTATNTPHKQTELDGNMYATVGEKLHGTNFVNNNEGAAEEDTTEGANYEKKDTTTEYRNLNIVRVPKP